MAEEKKNGKMNGGMTCGCAGAMGCNCQHGCGCGCGGHGHSWTFFLLRTLLTIIILMVVFWFGVVAGRLGGVRSYMIRTGYATPAYNGGGMGAGVPMIPANTTSSTGY